MIHRVGTVVLAAAVLGGCSLFNSVTPMTAEHPVARDGSGTWAPLQEIGDLANPGTQTLTVTSSHHTLLGTEGYVVFARLTDADGAAVVDHRVPDDGLYLALPPGTYEFRAYYRNCDGNCALLDGPEKLCTITIDIADTQSQVDINVGGGECQVLGAP